MSARIAAFFVWGVLASTVAAQAPPLKPSGPGGSKPTAPSAGNWKPADASSATKPVAKSTTVSSAIPAPKPASSVESATVSTGSVTLPSNHGQVWREYDISAYTSKITTTEKPEQALVDWILRETGTEVWFSEPLGLLSADRRALKVYHTPEMHRLVADIVDRFTASAGQAHLLGLHMVTVGSPNWRGKTQSLMRPIAVQSPGVEAWITSKENAALLLGELKKRPDFREHNAPSMVIQNGQSQTVARTRPRGYLRAAQGTDPSRPIADVEAAQIDEGFVLQISPLFSTDGKVAEAVLKCQIDQVEKLLPVFLDSPAAFPAKPKPQIQVPQLASWRLHERFRWPADQVIVMSCGMVAAPVAEKAAPLEVLIGAAGRADVLIFVECFGPAKAPLVEVPRSAGAIPENRGRY